MRTLLKSTTFEVCLNFKMFDSVKNFIILENIPFFLQLLYRKQYLKGKKLFFVSLTRKSFCQMNCEIDANKEKRKFKRRPFYFLLFYFLSIASYTYGISRMFIVLHRSLFHCCYQSQSNSVSPTTAAIGRF